MDDADAERLADLVSERIFSAMEKFIGALEEVVRDNERQRSQLEYVMLENRQLGTKVQILESILCSREDADEVNYVRDDSDDEEDLGDRDDGYFDWGPDDDDGNDPKFD